MNELDLDDDLFEELDGTFKIAAVRRGIRDPAQGLGQEFLVLRDRRRLFACHLKLARGVIMTHQRVGRGLGRMQLLQGRRCLRARNGNQRLST